MRTPVGNWCVGVTTNKRAAGQRAAPSSICNPSASTGTGRTAAPWPSSAARMPG